MLTLALALALALALTLNPIPIPNPNPNPNPNPSSNPRCVGEQLRRDHGKLEGTAAPPQVDIVETAALALRPTRVRGGQPPPYQGPGGQPRAHVTAARGAAHRCTGPPVRPGQPSWRRPAWPERRRRST